MQKSLGRKIGIDFGSSYCCAAVMDNQTIRMIPNQIGNYLTPSYVAFTETQNLVGQIAKNQAHKNPKNTVYSFRKFLERDYVSKYTQKGLDSMSYKIEKNKDGKIIFKATFPQYDEEFNMKHIAVMLLKNIKKSAQNFLGETCDGAVISIPAYYNFYQREQLKSAGKQAGFKSVRLCHESALVAIADAYYSLQNSERQILVYDLGGQKCEVYLGISYQGVVEAKAISTSHIGGQDFTQRLLDYCVKQYYDQTKIKIQQHEKAFQRLKLQVEKAKRALTSVIQTVVEIEQFQGAKFVEIPIQRSTFQKLCQDLFSQTLNLIENVLIQSQLSKKDIHDIIVIGGSSRIPKIDELICDYFDGKNSKKSLNRDQAISYGAAICAATFFPQARSTEKLDRMLNIDIVPFSIGVKLYDENIKIIIPKNTTFPAKRSQIFTTTKDNQQKVLIQLIQIDQNYQNQNILLGVILIQHIALALKGTPAIQVVLQIDQQFCLSVQISLKINNWKSANKIYKLAELSEMRHNNLSKQQKNKFGIKIKQQVGQQNQQKQTTSSNKKQDNKSETIKNEKNQQTDLGSMGLSQQGLAILRKNQIHDCKILLLATQADLQQIGMPLGDRIKIRLARK